MKRIVFALLILLSGAGTGRGDIVLYDHTSIGSLVGDPNLPNFTDSILGIYSVNAVRLAGDYTINKVGVVFGTEGIAGNPNGGSLGDIGNWKVGYFPTLLDFQTNPFDLGSGGNAVFTTFATPSNSSWMTIIGSKDGYDLRYAEFDISIPTSGTAFISAFADMASPLTRIGAPYSVGGVGTVGSDPSWIATTLINGGTISSLPDIGAPFSFAAMRVEGVASVPEPSSMVLCGIGSLALMTVRCRQRRNV